MQPSAPEGPTGRLVQWAADLQWDDVPARVRSRAAHLLLDGLGCALVGAQLPWSRIATDALVSLEGPGRAVVIGTGVTTTPSAAVMLNSSFVQGFELDDFHPQAPLHSVSLLLPSLMATAEHLQASTGRAPTGRELLLAAVVGLEVGPRIGKALHGSEMLARGWHSGAVFGGIASAVACAKLRSGSAAEMEDAIGFGATQAAGLMSAQYEAMGKRMQHGFAARNGFQAAGLATAGYTGIDQVLEREYGGFLAVYGEGHSPDADAVVAELGEHWETETIMVKSYAVMGGLHGAVEAALGMRDDVDLSAVESVHLRVGEVVYHHGWWEPQRPLAVIGAQMHIGYATAVALLDGAAGPRQFTDARLDADDVWRLVDRTTVEHDAALDDLPLLERFQTHLTITLADGSEIRRTVIAPHGNPADPVTNDELESKFLALASLVTTDDRAKEVVRAVLSLDEAPSVEPLLDLLAAPVGRALD